jgi:signal transduction histidine kinase
VVPTERYTAAGDDARLVEIALLQQRARALAAEVERGAALERRLQEALAGQERLLACERAARADAEAARAEAEAANRAKSQFLSTMSHELRTPLNAIAGYAELLALGIHGPVTDAQCTALGRIRASQRHLLGLVNEVLDYARIEAGAVHYEVRDVPVAEVIGAVEPLVAPQLAAKGLDFAHHDRGGALPAVRADAEKLRQVLLNLLSNAIKFTEPGGRVAVACAADGERVAVRVVDSGIGIAADQLDRIFEPFVQVDSKLTRTHEGTGLGLAISRDLARGMGGDITVESAVGQGSTFVLTLPSAGAPPAGAVVSAAAAP